MALSQQIPTRFFMFACGHKTVLPSVGVSDEYAYWQKKKSNRRGGMWRCRICKVKQEREKAQGLGSQGILGWAIRLLHSAKSCAQLGGYRAPNISPEDLVLLRKTTTRCALTGRSLDWSKTRPHLHHNHQTGEVIGFVCPLANHAEGMLAAFTDAEKLLFFKRAFPNI